MALRTSGVRQPSVWASVVSDDALALRDWLLVLGFTEDLMIPGERDGLVHHCQLDWPEGGRVLLSSTGERSTPCRPGTSSLHVVTSDPDAVMERALKLGATDRAPARGPDRLSIARFHRGRPRREPLDLRDFRRVAKPARWALASRACIGNAAWRTREPRTPSRRKTDPVGVKFGLRGVARTTNYQFSGHFPMPPAGLEPATVGLKVRCSTN